MRKMQSLNRKPLQRRYGRLLVGCSLQELLDIHDGDDKPTTPQQWEEPSRWPNFAARSLAFKSNEK
jgi:hypothetical protein